MKILLGTFKENAAELSAFLEPRLGTKATVNGAELDVDDDGIKDTIRAHHVKTYMKRFLSHKERGSTTGSSSKARNSGLSS